MKKKQPEKGVDRKIPHVIKLEMEEDEGEVVEEPKA